MPPALAFQRRSSLPPLNNSLQMSTIRTLLSVVLFGVLVFPATALTQSSSDDFHKSLRNRVQESRKLPLIFRESLLPRQRMGMTVKNGVILDLVRHRLQYAETPTFGMLGLEPSTGEAMRQGVEVKILSYSMNQWKTGVRLEVKAGRRFQLTDQIEESKEGWYQAPVQFLDSKIQEEQETHANLAEARRLASQFTDPNKHLINKWLTLAREQERFSSQVDDLLNDLGEIPDDPSERAFWVGALINPTPKIHLAFEIRQPLLKATTARERVQISLDALCSSIRRMDPTMHSELSPVKPMQTSDDGDSGFA